MSKLARCLSVLSTHSSALHQLKLQLHYIILKRIISAHWVAPTSPRMILMLWLRVQSLPMAIR